MGGQLVKCKQLGALKAWIPESSNLDSLASPLHGNMAAQPTWCQGLHLCLAGSPAASQFATLKFSQFLKRCTLLLPPQLQKSPKEASPRRWRQSSLSIYSANLYSSSRSHHRYHFLQGVFPDFPVQVKSPCPGPWTSLLRALVHLRVTI